MDMKIGFARAVITPPLGTELGGYAGYRPCSGAHDPLYCKAVVLEQEGLRWGLVALDLMAVDEVLCRRIAQRAGEVGLAAERMVICAIHTHAAPHGLIPGEGPLAAIDAATAPQNPAFLAYMEGVIRAAYQACAQAVDALEPFQVRTASGLQPCIGSERHTGTPLLVPMTAIQCRTQSGKELIIYDFPCHPTVMSAANLEATADFAAGIEGALGTDMAVFLNGPAGDISTRFTRREATFAECARLGAVAAAQVRELLRTAQYRQPEPLRGRSATVTLQARSVEPEEEAARQLEERTRQWQQAVDRGADAGTVRILKSYVEGAGVNLQFARSMSGIRTFDLPVSVFRVGNLRIAAVPGELFSTLLPQEPLMVISYANGYYRYIADCGAYDAQYYEAMAAILARGEGERLMQKIQELLSDL